MTHTHTLTVSGKEAVAGVALIPAVTFCTAALRSSSPAHTLLTVHTQHTHTHTLLTVHTPPHTTHTHTHTHTHSPEDTLSLTGT